MLKDQQAAGDADGKTEYVQKGIPLSFEQVAYGKLQVIFKHDMLVLLFRSQTFHGVGQSGPDGLEADRDKRDEQGQKYDGGKHPPG
jgi:hypothetical protein